MDGEQTSEDIEVAITFPNIVLIMVDDMGHGDSRVFNQGSAIQTPNLERLAATGMRFSHAHSTAALCSPTRYSPPSQPLPRCAGEGLGPSFFLLYVVADAA